MIGIKGKTGDFGAAMDEWRSQMRKEFEMLIERCGCSRANLRIDKEEIKENPKIFKGIKPVEPSCTPKKCFPTLYNFLYPKGGFSKVSYMVQNERKRNRQ